MLTRRAKAYSSFGSVV